MHRKDAQDENVNAENREETPADGIARRLREHENITGPNLLPERNWLHESGYGGKDGKPRTSSDEREDSERNSADLSRSRRSKSGSGES